MPITDPVAIRYTNEVVRPMCEKIRALKAESDSALVTYAAGDRKMEKMKTAHEKEVARLMVKMKRLVPA